MKHVPYNLNRPCSTRAIQLKDEMWREKKNMSGKERCGGSEKEHE